MGAMVELTDEEWDVVADLFDPRGRAGAPALYPRRLMVDAMLWLARTGSQWRYLPDRFPPWEAVWQQWRRWRENGRAVREPRRRLGMGPRLPACRRTVET